jgi:hypothetical protein
VLEPEATRRRAEGATLDELARSYNVDISTIRRATRPAMSEQQSTSEPTQAAEGIPFANF